MTIVMAYIEPLSFRDYIMHMTEGEIRDYFIVLLEILPPDCEFIFDSIFCILGVVEVVGIFGVAKYYSSRH